MADADQRRSATGSPALFIIIAAGFSLVAFLAARLNLFLDEAFTLDTTGGSFAYALSQTLRFELQPPLYFLLMHGWRQMDESIFAARLFSVLCYPLTLMLLLRLLPRPRAGFPVVPAAALLAFHPFLIWASLEIRVYSFILLLSLLLLWTFREGFLEGEARWARVAHVLLATTALYTQYFSGFLLLALGTALLFLRPWRVPAVYAGCMALAGLAFLPMVPIIPGQVSDHTQDVRQARSVAEGLRLMLWRIEYLLLPTASSGPVGLAGWLSRGLLLSMAWVFFRRRELRRDPWMRALLLIAAVLAGCFALIHPITGPDFLAPRHTTILFGPVLLAASGAIAALGRRTAFAVMAVMLAWEGMALRAAYSPGAKAGDWKRVARHLETRGGAWPVVVYPAWDELPLAYHYAGEGAFLPVPDRQYLRDGHLPGNRLRDKSQLEPVFASAADSMWLVIGTRVEECQGCDLLDSFLEDRYQVVDRRDFFKSQVRLLARRTARPEADSDPLRASGSETR